MDFLLEAFFRIVSNLVIFSEINDHCSSNMLDMWSFLPSNEKYDKLESWHTERRILSPTAKVSSVLCVGHKLVNLIVHGVGS